MVEGVSQLPYRKAGTCGCGGGCGVRGRLVRGYGDSAAAGVVRAGVGDAACEALEDTGLSGGGRSMPGGVGEVGGKDARY